MKNGIKQLRRAHFSCAVEGTRRADRCRVPFLWFVSLGKQRNEQAPRLNQKRIGREAEDVPKKSQRQGAFGVSINKRWPGSMQKGGEGKGYSAHQPGLKPLQANLHWF